MKIKRVLSLGLAVFTLLSLFTVMSFAQKDVLTFSINEFGNAKLDACDPATTGTVVVPSTVEIDGQEYNVRVIGKGAFSGCAYIQRITIEEGVTEIENKAFENCTALETLDIPQSLMRCPDDAFDGCNTVTVNGYTTNYQFYATNLFQKNVVFNCIDAKEVDNARTNSLTSLIRSIIAYILSLFGIKF